MDYQNSLGARSDTNDLNGGDELCSICQVADANGWFLKLFDERIPRKAVKLIDYGTLDQLWKRRFCPFCRLIVGMLSSHPLSECRWSAAAPLDTSLGQSNARCTVQKQLGYAFRAEVRYSDQFVGFISEVSPSRFTGSGGNAQLDISLICRWLQTCETEHGWADRGHLSHLSPRLQNPIDLVFMDVVSGNLVRAPSSRRYIALSYVWGAVPMLRMTVANRASLELEGALFESMYEIPQVIQDAMQLVAKLGERYLWVDSLCIEQDSVSQKHTQLAQMDMVYSHALLTLVALSGSDASASLPGVRQGTRVLYNTTGIVQRLQLHAQPPEVWYSFRTSKYETRAWTLQERLLSKRCLYFLNDQVAFTCHGMGGFENRDIQGHIPASLDNLLGPLQASRDKCFSVYTSLVYEYTKRELSYRIDTLNTFAGIISVLQRFFKCHFLSGLPESMLDISLLWVASPNEVQSRNNLFPSWTWAGWVGASVYYIGPWFHNRYVSSGGSCKSLNSIKSEIERFETQYETPIRIVGELSSDTLANSVS